MAGLAKDKIAALISCEKQVVEPPKREMVNKNRSLRNNMKLTSIDGLQSFSVFMRISEEFPEDFSIGLIFHNLEGKNYVLFRCNGPHGESISDNQSDTPHYDFHEHLIVPGSNYEMYSSVTKEYGTYQDAIAHFVKKCNIIDADRYFSFLTSNENLQFELGL